MDYCNRPFRDEYTQTYSEFILIESRVDAMNRVLIDNWNSVVAEDDTVFFLGDLCMGKIDESLKCITQLNGQINMIPGNHDRNWFGGKKSHSEWNQRYLDAGIHSILGNSVDEGCGVVNLDYLFPGYSVDACHFPFTGDSGDEDRYSAYRPEDIGQFLLHGHVHDKWRTKDRMINVGVDVWNYTPVSIETIKVYMEEDLSYEPGMS